MEEENQAQAESHGISQLNKRQRWESCIVLVLVVVLVIGRWVTTGSNSITRTRTRTMWDQTLRDNQRVSGVIIFGCWQEAALTRVQAAS